LETKLKSLPSFWWLVLILFAYLVVATIFAVVTPAWQAPDEPAHYNYVAHLAGADGLPVLHLGDYDQDYLERLKAERFPPELPIHPLRYEFHQPPLYYITAIPAFWLGGGNLIVLRLYSVLLGAGVLVLIYACARTLLPYQPAIYLGATAFAALLPMHVAMMAAVNNDGAAELLIAGSLLALFRWMRTQFDPSTPSGQKGHQGTAQLLLVGMLVGLALVTKATAYVLLPVTAIAVIAGSIAQPRGIPGRTSASPAPVRLTINLFLLLAPALAIGLPLWLRNVTVYGPGDFLGLQWHDLVVVGQPRTGDWIQQNGWNAYWERAWHFTFNSFWGVFGWLGIFMERRIYLLFLLVSGAISIGVAWAAARVARGRVALSRFQLWGLAVLALLLLAVVASYGWYNLQYVQHQGRYLFPALLPISMLVAVGWREVLRPPVSAVAGLLAAATGMGLAVMGLLGGDLDKWAILFCGLAAIAFLLHAWLAGRWQPSFLDRWQGLAWSAPALLLFLLDVAIPFVYIVPQAG
jgi:4-amino-4-deoxy-L-arabinose transferase-like glycosyltransferase